MLKIIEDLILLARKRKKNPVEGSYTNKLLSDKSELDKQISKTQKIIGDFKTEKSSEIASSVLVNNL